MHRRRSILGLAASAAAGLLPSQVLAASNLKMMIPANPGGGWDQTGRSLAAATARLNQVNTATRFAVAATSIIMSASASS